MAGLNHPWELWDTGSVPDCLDWPLPQMMVWGVGYGLWLVGFAREAVGSSLLSRKPLTEGGAAPMGSGVSVGNAEDRRWGWCRWELRTAGWSEQTLCPPAPDSSLPGVLHAKGSCACTLSCLSHVRLFATWTVARQAPLSMGFSRRGYWSGLPCPPPRDLPDPRMEPRSPALQTDSLPLRPLDQVAPKGLLNSSCPGKGSRGFRIGSSAPSLGNQTPSAGTQLSASKAASLLDVHMMSRVLHVRLHDRHCTDLAVIGFSYHNMTPVTAKRVLKN